MNRWNAAMVAAVLGILLLQPCNASAANMPYSLSVTPFAGGYIFGGNERQNMPVYGLSLGYNFTPHWAFELTGTAVPDSVMVTSDASGSLSLQRWNAYGARGDLLYHFLPEHRFVPYVAAGGGATFLASKKAPSTLNESFAGYGGGIKYFLNDTVALRLDARHNLVLDSATTTHDIQNDFAYTAGITFQLGGERHQVPEVPAAVTPAPKVSAPKPAPVQPPAERPAQVRPQTKVPAEELAGVKKPTPPAKQKAPSAPAAKVGEKRGTMPPPAAQARPVISNITGKGNAIDIVATGGITEYRIFALKAPARLVIDIPGAASVMQTKVVPVSTNMVDEVRIGRYPDHLRIVLDMKKNEVPGYQVTKTGSGLNILLTPGLKK